MGIAPCETRTSLPTQDATRAGASGMMMTSASRTMRTRMATGMIEQLNKSELWKITKRDTKMLLKQSRNYKRLIHLMKVFRIGLMTTFPNLQKARMKG